MSSSLRYFSLDELWTDWLNDRPSTNTDRLKTLGKVIFAAKFPGATLRQHVWWKVNIALITGHCIYFVPFTLVKKTCWIPPKWKRNRNTSAISNDNVHPVGRNSSSSSSMNNHVWGCTEQLINLNVIAAYTNYGSLWWLIDAVFTRALKNK